MVYCKIAISISAGTSTDDRWVVGRPKIRCANSPSGCEGKWVSYGAAIEGLILRLGDTTPKQARIFGFDAGRRPRPAAFSPEKIVALFWLFTSQKRDEYASSHGPRKIGAAGVVCSGLGARNDGSCTWQNR